MLITLRKSMIEILSATHQTNCLPYSPQPSWQQLLLLSSQQLLFQLQPSPQQPCQQPLPPQLSSLLLLSPRPLFSQLLLPPLLLSQLLPSRQPFAQPPFSQQLLPRQPA